MENEAEQTRDDRNCDTTPCEILNIAPPLGLLTSSLPSLCLQISIHTQDTVDLRSNIAKHYSEIQSRNAELLKL